MRACQEEAALARSSLLIHGTDENSYCLHQGAPRPPRHRKVGRNPSRICSFDAGLKEAILIIRNISSWR